MTSHTLDMRTLYAHLDQVRRDAGKTWEEVSRETGIPRSGLWRVSRGRGVGGDSLASLLAWMEMDDLSAFIGKRTA